MPQVASETTTHGLKPSLPNPARARQASERAHGSPFENLLDDGALGATERRSQSAPDDKAARAARSEPAQPPAKPTTKSKDSKPAKPDDGANTADAGKPAKTGSKTATKTDDKTDKPNDDSKAASDGMAVAKAAEQTIEAGGGKPTDSLTPADLTTAPAMDPIQAITPAAALVTTVAPAPGAIPPAAPGTVPQAAPGVVPQAAPAAVPQAEPGVVLQAAPAAVPQAEPGVIPQAAPAATDHPVIVATQNAAIPAVQAPKANPADLAALQAVTGKPADDSKSPANAAPELNGDGKPQPAAGDTVKETASHPHDDVPANADRAASAQAQAAIKADAHTDTHAAAPKAPGDAAQPLVLTAPSHSASPSAANPAAAAPQLAPQTAAVPLVGVAIEIAGKALAGKNRFEIRLDPPELGRIEVRLDVDRDGNVTSRLVADRADTLDLLRRDAAGLERALQDAGLKTADNGMQFSLRDFSMGREQGNAPTPGTAQLVVNDDALAASDASQRNTSRLAGLRGGIDIRV